MLCAQNLELLYSREQSFILVNYTGSGLNTEAMFAAAAMPKFIP